MSNYKKKQQIKRKFKVKSKKFTNIKLNTILIVSTFLLTLVFLSRISHSSFFVSAQTVPTYYVSPSGNDLNSGTSSNKPWKTLQKINTQTFSSGVNILFEGGKTFMGNLTFDQNDKGTQDKPIRISSYGSGKATITALQNMNALNIFNTSGYIIENINFRGAGTTSRVGNGINIYSDLPGDIALSFFLIKNVEVKYFGETGITIGTWNGKTRFTNVTIDTVSSHDNGKNGIIFYAQVPYTHENILIHNSKSYQNTGIANDPNPSGSGIVFGGVNGGKIDGSTAYENGSLCNHPSGPVGIFVYDSSNVIIDNNKSYRNRTGSWVDGDGFDFGQNTINSVMQNNTSYENDGPGFLIDHSPNQGSNSGNIVAYNSTKNDGHKNGNFGIMVWGRVENADIHDNTIYATRGNNQTSGGIHISNVTIEDKFTKNILVRNNNITAVDSIPLIKVDPAQLQGSTQLAFRNNTLTASNGKFSIIWGNQEFNSKSSWTTATGNN